jgi:hypothetical protein
MASGEELGFPLTEGSPALGGEASDEAGSP